MGLARVSDGQESDGGTADPEPHLLRTHPGPSAEATTSSHPLVLCPLTFLFLFLKASLAAHSWKGVQSGVPSLKTPNSGRRVHGVATPHPPLETSLSPKVAG